MPPADALDFFLPSTSISCMTPLGGGHINDTWRVDLADGRKMVLQRLHPSVFPDPEAVMSNMRRITGHLSRHVGDGVLFFRLLASPEGQDHFIDSACHCWRLLTYIERTRTLSCLERPEQAAEIGRLLGRFHGLAAGIDPADLADPLPFFHVTPRYLEQYDAVRDGRSARNEEEGYCYDVIAAQRHTAPLLEEARAGLSRQVIHGDPKTANFLFAAEGDRAVSLIDLDTVKPGLLLHDLGDCLRSCCNRRGEAHEVPEATVFDPEFFEALLTGYSQAAAHLLTPADRALLVEAVKLISFELGLRFFTDHLSGDRYFKVDRPGQNLHRSLIQLHLNRSIREQQADLEARLAAIFP